MDVVVHRLRDGDDALPLLVHPEAVRQRVIAADGDEDVDLERIQDTESLVREVERTLRVVWRREELGDVCLCHASRVRSTGVKKGAPGSVDGSNGRRVEHDRVLRNGLWV